MEEINMKNRDCMEQICGETIFLGQLLFVLLIISYDMSGRAGQLAEYAVLITVFLMAEDVMIIFMSAMKRCLFTLSEVRHGFPDCNERDDTE